MPGIARLSVSTRKLPGEHAVTWYLHRFSNKMVSLAERQTATATSMRHAPSARARARDLPRGGGE